MTQSRHLRIELVVNKRLLSIVVFESLVSGCAATSGCDLSADDIDIQSQEEFVQWYEDSRGCEHSPDVSSDVLFGLVIAIGWAELDGYPANRPKHLYELIFRAANLGNQEALLEMAGLYLSGNDELSIERNEDVYNCFSDLADTATDEDSDFSVPVSKCLVMGD